MDDNAKKERSKVGIKTQIHIKILKYMGEKKCIVFMLKLYVTAFPSYLYNTMLND